MPRFAAPALLALSIALGMTSGAVAYAPSPGCPSGDSSAAELTLRQFDAAVFCLINRERAELGLARLRSNPILRRASRRYAGSMLRGHFFSHHGDFGGRRTGSTVIGRLREMGYIRPGYAWIVGENLHWTTAEPATPAEVVQAWIDSAIHRIFLLKPKFEELGVAAVRGVPYDDAGVDGITVASEFGFRRSR